MKNIKKMLVILLAACMAMCLLAGCKKKAEPVKESSAIEESSEATEEESVVEGESEVEEVVETPEEPEDSEGEVFFGGIAPYEVAEGTRIFKLIEMKGEEEPEEGEMTIADLEAFGLYYILYMNEDGTGAVDAYGDITEFTYSLDTMTITVDEEEIPFLMNEDGTITISTEGFELLFSEMTREDYDALPVAAEVAEEGTEGAEEVVENEEGVEEPAEESEAEPTESEEEESSEDEAV